MPKMVSNIYACLWCLAALVLRCESQLDGNFWWLNQSLRDAALAEANAPTGVSKDVEEFGTESEESGAISFIDDYGKVQTNKEPVRKDKLIILIDPANADTQPFKAREADIGDGKISFETTANTWRYDGGTREAKMSTDDADGGDWSEDEEECGAGDCSSGSAATEDGSRKAEKDNKPAEKDDCECKTYYDCFSNNGTISPSRTGTSKCANRAQYMICCVIPSLNTATEPAPQPRPAQTRSFNSGFVFSEDPYAYSGSYNAASKPRRPRSPSESDYALADTSDPYWNIKNKDDRLKPSIPKSSSPKIVSETNGYPTEPCPDSGVRNVVRPGETTSGIKKLPQNWNIKKVSGVIGENKLVSGSDLVKDLDETPSVLRKLQRRHFMVFQEFNPGFEAPATTQKSHAVTQKVVANSGEDSDYYIPGPKMTVHKKKKFGVPESGYGAAEPESGDVGDYDSVVVDSFSEADAIYPGCGEVYANAEDTVSPRLKAKYSHTHQTLSVLFGDEDQASPCTAALIHPRVAVAPAHCVSRHKNLRIQSPVSLHERLVQTILHPGFKTTDRRNDIALLIWRNPLMLSPRLQPVCLPPLGTSFSSSSCTTSRSAEAGKRTSVLSKEECQRRMLGSLPRGRRHSTERFLCSVLAPTTSTCAIPDEENPLLCSLGDRWHLAGTPIGLEGSPGLYTDISQFSSWIQQVLEDTYII